MFYTPKYCCDCGEKIERAERSFTDSGRFCDVCKHDFVLLRAAPFAFFGLMTVIGIFGVGSYWRSVEKPLNAANRQFTPNPPVPGKNSLNNTSQVSSNSSVQKPSMTNSAPSNALNASNLATKPAAKQAEPVPAVETVYYCGAQTKKGTPCSRRVRGGGRCWQHQGQNAMLPPEKLLVRQ
jgi:hypothetical protein